MGSILKKRKREHESKSPAGKRQKGALRIKPSVFSRTEKKAVDVSTTVIEFNTTGAKVLLNGTIPGNGIQNRLGRKIRMSSVQIQGMIIDTAGYAGVEEFCHLMLVYDSQCNGAAFAIADFMQSCDVAGTLTSGTSFDFVNMSNSERFKVLRHQRMHFTKSAAGTQAVSRDTSDYLYGTSVDWFVKLKNMPVQYNTGTAGTIADLQTGALYLVTLSNAVTATSANHQLAFGARVRFTDM